MSAYVPPDPVELEQTKDAAQKRTAAEYLTALRQRIKEAKEKPHG